MTSVQHGFTEIHPFYLFTTFYDAVFRLESHTNHPLVNVVKQRHDYSNCCHAKLSSVHFLPQTNKETNKAN